MSEVGNKWVNKMCTKMSTSKREYKDKRVTVMGWDITALDPSLASQPL